MQIARALFRGAMLVFVNNPTQLCCEEYEKGVNGGHDVAGSQQINKEDIILLADRTQEAGGQAARSSGPGF